MKQNLRDRRYGLGGSDAAIIMSGKPDRILRLWEEKTGRREPEDLTWNLPVQIGIATEPVNLRWTLKDIQKAFPMARYLQPEEIAKARDRKRVSWREDQASFVADFPDFMVCTPDGVVELEPGRIALVEAKHTNSFMRGRDAELFSYYFPQLAHNMHVLGITEAFLGVIFDNNAHQLFHVEQDTDYLNDLIQAETAFWHAIETDTPPEGIKPVEPPKITELRVIDAEKTNWAADWREAATAWCETREAAHQHKKAEKKLRSLIPEDAAAVFGAGVRATRDRAGRIRLKVEEIEGKS